MMITVSEAKPGDILLDSAGQAWQRGPEFCNWSTFTGPVFAYEPWSDAYGPQGPLTLLARGGHPV